MGQYTANPLFTAAAASLLAAAALTGCSSTPAASDNYKPELPPASYADAAPMAPAEAPPVTPAPAGAAVAPRLRDQTTLRYVVKKGDTLWGIASHFLENPWEWPEIWFGNGQVKNPHKIYPGDVLSLVNVKGYPQVVVEGSSGPATIDETVKVSPHVRVEGLDDAIPAIPIDAIRDFLANTRVVTPEEMEAAPYMVDFLDPQLTAGAGSKAYVKGLKPAMPSVLDIVRMGQTYHDPETGELLGYEAIPIGTAQIVDTSQSLAIANLATTVREVLPGDRLLPQLRDSFDPYFYPKAPAVTVHARIIGALGGVSQITQYQVIALNRGSSQGLQRGDVLRVKQSGRVSRDPHAESSDTRIVLPDLDAGLVMVFKTMPRLSYALVMSADRAIHRLDKAENPGTLR